jgi:hypothetical protein
MMDELKKKRTLGRLSVFFAVCVVMVLTSAVTAVGSSQQLNASTLFQLDQMKYSFEFVAPTVQAKSTNAAYTTVDLQGCLPVGKQAGDPMLPVKVVQLLLPPKKTVSSITILGTPVVVPLTNINLVDKPIFPQQPPIPIGEAPPAFMMNTNIYSSDALFPSTTFSNYQIGYSHGYGILSLNLNPMQYNPKQGTLVYYPEMTVTINLQTDNSANLLYRNNPADEAYVKTLVSNPGIAEYYSRANVPTMKYQGGLCDQREQYDYVIVTTTANGLDHWDIGGTLTYNWESLMAKHSEDGLTSTLVTVQDINANPAYWNSSYYPRFNDTQAHIREFCKDAYLNWGTKYILFGGDADTLPPRLMDSGGEYGVDADLYWSNLDNSFNGDHDSQWGEEGDNGFDLYSELAIGRITCDVPQDVSNWLTKSFYYADSSESDYLDNAAFYGGDTGWNCQGDDFMDYSAVKGTSTWLGPNPNNPGPFPTWVPFQYGFETWNETNPNNMYDLSQKWTEAPSPNSGWRPNGVAGLRDAINNDLVTIISGIAHADNQMSLDVYASSWQTQYHNTKPFFIHDYGCHCGDFNAGDGVLEVMLFDSDTKLSFGCVYNTGYGWGQFESTNSSSAFQTKEFWGWFLDVQNHSGDLSHWQFGVAQAWSKDQMAPMIDWQGGTWRETIQCCLLFGDPAQSLKTSYPSDPPEQPSKPVGPTYGRWNTLYSFSSSTNDPNGDNILYLFDFGDGTNSGWLGPFQSGETATTSHVWTTLGIYEVKIKAKDTWGCGSPWSESLMVNITDNYQPNTPVITGPSKVKPSVTTTFTATATDNDSGQTLSFDIDWGDGNVTTGVGPYGSGQTANVTHSWAQKGTYMIKARATDNLGAQSDWGTLQVVCPTEYQFSLAAFLQHLFDRFPNLFPILRHVLGY